jgi:tripartite-type tricarboxylate transporter receptor subunit TctC
MVAHLGAERPSQLSDVPNAKEQGFDVEMTPERGIAADGDQPEPEAFIAMRHKQLLWKRPKLVVCT